MSKYAIPKLKNTHRIAVAMLVTILTLAGCATLPPPQKDRVVLIFSDVTSSLVKSEREQVATLTSKVVDGLPPGTRYYVYPVQIEAQKLKAIDEGRIVVENPAMDIATKAARKKKISTEIETLYEKIKSTKRPPDSEGNPDYHTCILYTLEFAQDQFKQFDPNADFELIYVSDMIEECNTTPMGKPISLLKTNITEEIKLAQKTNLNFRLSHVRVSMIIPATNETYEVGGRPNLSHLRDFWEAVLSKCGFNEQQLAQDEHFYFSSGLPLHLNPQQIKAAR